MKINWSTTLSISFSILLIKLFKVKTCENETINPNMAWTDEESLDRHSHGSRLHSIGALNTLNLLKETVICYFILNEVRES